ncbi:hypothetical protein PL321_11805 [Caloramator sp. mosi_1]|nr:hypothetical protein [Caloramator sp. mosi_1]WDC83422.1 hypothetical protein PL321_11805 [Caloramator sp. mosi_1]
MLYELSNESTIGIEITGGEPTLHPNFKEIVVMVQIYMNKC